MGRPRIEPHDRITIAIRLPRELHEALVEEAIERDMSVNALLTIAVRRWLETAETFQRPGGRPS